MSEDLAEDLKGKGWYIRAVKDFNFSDEEKAEIFVKALEKIGFREGGWLWVVECGNYSHSTRSGINESSGDTSY